MNRLLWQYLARAEPVLTPDPAQLIPRVVYPDRIHRHKVHASTIPFLSWNSETPGAYDPATLEWLQPILQLYLLRRLHPAMLGWPAHQIEPSFFPIPELSWWQPASIPERNWVQRRYAHAWRDPAFVNEWETIVNPPVAGTARLRTLVGVGV